MLIKKKVIGLIVLTVGLIGIINFLLTSCAQISDVEATIARDEEIIKTAFDKSSLPTTPKDINVIRMRDDIWLGDTSLRHKSSDLLPVQFERKDGITLVSGKAIKFANIVKKIHDLTGIPVRISDDVTKLVGAYEGDDDTSTSTESTGIPATTKDTMIVSYSGSLSVLLDQIAIRFNIWWRYENDELYFYNLETKTFTLYSLPTTHSVGSSIRSTDSGSGASINQSSEVALETWNNIKSTLESILSSSGKLVTDPTSGTITVTTTPINMREITRFITEQNRRLARQIAINVKLLQVDITNESRFGLDLKTAFQWQTSSGLTSDFTGPYTATDPVGLTMAIVGSTGRHWERWDNTTAIVDALATQGSVSLLTTSTVTTLNNRPAPIQVAKTMSYVRNITSTVRDGGTTRDVAITPSDLELGLTIDVLPRILDHGRVLLMFSMNLIELISLEKFTTQDSTVQLPTIETRGFSQEIAMLTGSTLVLTGFEKIENSAEKRGLGTPDFQLFGGSNGATNRRTVLVILITPEVLDSPLSPESRISSF